MEPGSSSHLTIKCCNINSCDHQISFSDNDFPEGTYYYVVHNSYHDQHHTEVFSYSGCQRKIRIFCSKCLPMLTECSQKRCYKKDIEPKCINHHKYCTICNRFIHVSFNEEYSKCKICEDCICWACIANDYCKNCLLRKEEETITKTIVNSNIFNINNDKNYDMIISTIVSYSKGYIINCCNKLQNCNNPVLIDDISILLQDNRYKNKYEYYYLKHHFTTKFHTETMYGRRYRIFCENCTNSCITLSGCPFGECHYNNKDVRINKNKLFDDSNDYQKEKQYFSKFVQNWSVEVIKYLKSYSSGLEFIDIDNEFVIHKIQNEFNWDENTANMFHQHLKQFMSDMPILAARALYDDSLYTETNWDTIIDDRPLCADHLYCNYCYNKQQIITYADTKCISCAQYNCSDCICCVGCINGGLFQHQRKCDGNKNKMCKTCVNVREMDDIINAIYESIGTIIEAQDILTLIAEFSIGYIIQCSNYEECQNIIYIDCKFKFHEIFDDFDNRKFVYYSVNIENVNEKDKTKLVFIYGEYCRFLCEKCTGWPLVYHVNGEYVCGMKQCYSIDRELKICLRHPRCYNCDKYEDKSEMKTNVKCTYCQDFFCSQCGELEDVKRCKKCLMLQ